MRILGPATTRPVHQAHLYTMNSLRLLVVMGVHDRLWISLSVRLSSPPHGELARPLTDRSFLRSSRIVLDDIAPFVLMCRLDMFSLHPQWGNSRAVMLACQAGGATSIGIQAMYVWLPTPEAAMASFFRDVAGTVADATFRGVLVLSAGILLGYRGFQRLNPPAMAKAGP
jgi:hypothetical protein